MYRAFNLFKIFIVMMNIAIIFLFKIFFLFWPKKKYPVLVVRIEHTLGDTILSAKLHAEYEKSQSCSIPLLTLRKNFPIYKFFGCKNIISLDYIKPRSVVTSLLCSMQFLYNSQKIYLISSEKILYPRFWEEDLGHLLTFAISSKNKIGIFPKGRFSVISLIYKKFYNTIIKDVDPKKHTLYSESKVYDCIDNRKFSIDYVKDLFSQKLRDNQYEMGSLSISLSYGHSKLKDVRINNIIPVINKLYKNGNLKKVIIYDDNNNQKSVVLLEEYLCSLQNVEIEKHFGKIGFTELIRELKKSEYFIGFDSGLTHLAAALGLRVIAFFSSSNLTLFKPLYNTTSFLTKSGCNPTYSSNLIDRCVCCKFKIKQCGDNLVEYLQ